MKIFTRNRRESVAALGEQRLIAAIRGWLGSVCPPVPFGIGDDCAVIPTRRNPLLVTTDPVIHGRHFDELVPPAAVGAKLLKRNLSDIAAMGGRPVAAVLSLALAPETSTAWLRGFYRGLAQAARAHAVKIVGGDIAEGPRGFFGAFLTLHGEADSGRVLTRHGAKRGDSLFVTGRLGGSRSGHHFHFTPRVAEGSWLVRRPEVVAMMDLTDGIAKDVWDLTPRGAVAAVARDAIPVSAAARKLSAKTKRAAWEHALCDGEDYELLFVVRGRVDAEDFQRRWRSRFRTPLRYLGRFEKTLTGEHVDWNALHGYEHLR